MTDIERIIELHCDDIVRYSGTTQEWKYDLAKSIEQYVQKRISEQNQEDFDKELDQHIQQRIFDECMKTEEACMKTVEEKIVEARIEELEALPLFPQVLQEYLNLKDF